LGSRGPGKEFWNIGNLPASPFRTDDWPLLEDEPFDGRSKEHEEWSSRRYQRLLKAWRENEERRVKEARKTLEELDKDGK